MIDSISENPFGFFFLMMAVCIVISVIYYRLARKKIKKKEALFAQRLTASLEAHGVAPEKRLQSGSFLIFIDYAHNKGTFLLTPKQLDTDVNNMSFFDLDKITGCSLVQDGTEVHHHAIVPGMIGAAVFGLGGAIAGSTAMHKQEEAGHLSVRVYIDDIRTPSLSIPFIGDRYTYKKNEPAYVKMFSFAQEVYGEFEGIVRINENRRQAADTAPKQQNSAPVQNVQNHNDSIAENDKVLSQINTLAKMRDDGILTDAEFNEKKKLLMDKLT